MPNEFLHYLNYVKNLKFEERPDYKFLKGLFGKLLGLVITNFNLKKSQVIFDWCFKDIEDIWQIYLNKEENTKKTMKEEESKEENDNDENDKENQEEGSDENGSKKDGLKSYFESSLGDDSDKSSIEESDNIKENSEESYDSSCDTIKNDFEPKKLSTNIKEIKQEQKLNEEVDKQIFKIIGKSLEDYITPQNEIENVEENKEDNDNKDI